MDLSFFKDNLNENNKLLGIDVYLMKHIHYK